MAIKFMDLPESKKGGGRTLDEALRAEVDEVAEALSKRPGKWARIATDAKSVGHFRLLTVDGYEGKFEVATRKAESGATYMAKLYEDRGTENSRIVGEKEKPLVDVYARAIG